MRTAKVATPKVAVSLVGRKPKRIAVRVDKNCEAAIQVDLGLVTQSPSGGTLPFYGPKYVMPSSSFYIYHG